MSFLSVMARLKTVVETMELAHAEMRDIQRDLAADVERRARKVPRVRPPRFQQLCDCACEEATCLNCPNEVELRRDAEHVIAFASRGGAARNVPPAVKRRRSTVIHVNRPESAGEEEEEEGEPVDVKRRLQYEERKVGCFPAFSAVTTTAQEAVVWPAAGFEAEAVAAEHKAAVTEA